MTPEPCANKISTSPSYKITIRSIKFRPQKVAIGLKILKVFDKISKFIRPCLILFIIIPRILPQGETMEFLTLVLIAACMYVLMFRPQRQRLAFGLFGAASFVMVGMWFVSTFGSVFGSGNY